MTEYTEINGTKVEVVDTFMGLPVVKTEIISYKKGDEITEENKHLAIKAIFRATHKDFKSVINGVLYVMYCHGSKGTVLAPLENLELSELNIISNRKFKR